MRFKLPNLTKKKLLRYLAFLSVSGSICLVAISTCVALLNFFIVSNSKPLIYSNINDVPAKQTALLLGAKVHSDGRLSNMLQDRADTAFELYQNKKVEKILVSGDHGTKTYDEVNAIKDYLLTKGVPAEDIFMDHAGFDTYDSIYRARDIFEVQSLIIVSQEFHLDRSIFIARALDVDAVAVKADKQEYRGIMRSRAREILARVKSGLDVVAGSKPKFLGEKIPITGESQKSWD